MPAWITGVPASGTGTTTINFTVAANSDPTSRSANIVIGGQTFAVTQAAAAVTCNYSLNPTSHNATAGGGSSSFDVTTTSSCGWTSSGVPSWITGVPSSGTGTTTINFTVAANTGPARSANISIEGQTFAVSQANGCTYGVAPGSLTFDASELRRKTSPSPRMRRVRGPRRRASRGSELFLVAAAPVTAQSDVDALVNPDPTSRTGNITIGGQTVTITQNP